MVGERIFFRGVHMYRDEECQTPKQTFQMKRKGKTAAEGEGGIMEMMGKGTK